MPIRDMTSALRCPRCKSANVSSSPLGEKHCGECNHSFGTVLKPSYTIDRNGDKTWLNPESEARHKNALARAAISASGTDPDHFHAALKQAHEDFVSRREDTPWYRFDLRYRYACYADAISKFAGQFTGKPI